MSETLYQPPYESLAHIYDHVMQHVDYRNWAGYIRSILTRYDSRPRELVDLACGTGNLTLELHRLGYTVTGIDVSASMIETARKKAHSFQADPSFLVGDLRQLTDLEDLTYFDAAVCVYDSFNYLLTEANVRSSIDEVFRILQPGSLFIFDVCTERNSLRYFSDVHDTGVGPGFRYERHSYYDRESKRQYNHFSIYLDSHVEVHKETHTQRIYAWDDLVSFVEASKFDLLDAFSGFTFKKGSARSDRIHFVLRRP